MGKSHLKRIVMPKSWPVHRKSNVWITRPKTGAHSFRKSMSINTIMKEMMNCANTTKEVKHILNAGKVKIDGIVRKDYKFAVGLMDVITIEGITSSSRLLLNQKGKFVLHELPKSESTIKPLKIINKKVLKGKKVQLNFIDGKNIIDKGDYKVDGTALLDFKTNKLKESIPFEKGAIVYITGGARVGEMGVIKEIIENEGSNPTHTICSKGKEEFRTLKTYAFVIGKTKPIISLPK